MMHHHHHDGTVSSDRHGDWQSPVANLMCSGNLNQARLGGERMRRDRWARYSVIRERNEKGQKIEAAALACGVIEVAHLES
jgi:hypothetical protein